MSCPVATPTPQTTTRQFDCTELAASLSALQELEDIYVRIMNPTIDVLDRRFAEIYGGVAAQAVTSGHAASAHSKKDGSCGVSC